jgi:hypothetical protein
MTIDTYTHKIGKDKLANISLAILRDHMCSILGQFIYKSNLSLLCKTHLLVYKSESLETWKNN